MVSQKQWIMVGIVVVVLVGIFIYFRTTASAPKTPVITLEGLYDENRVLIQKPLSASIVRGVGGVKYVSFRIYAKNLDVVPLKLSVTELTPKEIDIEKPNEQLTVGSNVLGMWVTSLIDIEPYQGTIQEFCATVESERVIGLRNSAKVTGCTDLRIDSDKLGEDSMVEIESLSGDANINPGCMENWLCEDWDVCDEIQKRICTDLNECGTFIDEPIKERICEEPTIEEPVPEPTREQEEPAPEEPEFQTNAVDGNYRSTDVWIKIQDLDYNYGGYSTYKCKTSDTFMRTPEDYPICTRQGYEITQRVYVDIGIYGVIFKP